MDPADYDKVLADPKEVRDRIFGSKIVIGLEQCMLFSTWGVKICMLSLFWRLTKNLRLHLYVRIIAVYVGIGFVVIMVTYYAVYCRPFSQYWAMPVKNMQCATYQYYSITQAVFNISSDAAMLAVPIPLLIKTQLKTSKKAILMCIMSLGLFTIVAAILNKVFNFASPLTTTYQIWYIREASTAIYVANLICLWPLLRLIFGLNGFQNSSRQYQQHGNRPNKGSTGDSRSVGTMVNRSQTRPSLPYSQALHLGGLWRHEKATGPANESRTSDEEAINMISAEHPDQVHELREMDTIKGWGNQKPQHMGNGRPTSPDLEAGSITLKQQSTSLEERVNPAGMNIHSSP
ncbi:hypothetical protein EYZ11_005356 [Aspergillus tanneri]|uniref:Rhodopsin domain-containing protein n=1 Tax=Aspergillus tanneri TaxID=1220188 RepID=A0A4S3JIC6_9EURO|nr:hypothetical protein EYZ11_005356 [Aspergillus tanneri]